MFEVTSRPVLCDVFVVFFSSILLLTLRGQFLDCATIAFSEGYDIMLDPNKTMWDKHIWFQRAVGDAIIMNENFRENLNIFDLIFVVPCIMLNSEINPTRCNNCVYSSQWLYSTCFG